MSYPKHIPYTLSDITISDHESKNHNSFKIKILVNKLHKSYDPRIHPKMGHNKVRKSGFFFYSDIRHKKIQEMEKLLFLAGTFSYGTRYGYIYGLREKIVI